MGVSSLGYSSPFPPFIDTNTFAFISPQWSHLIVLHNVLLAQGLYNRALEGLAMPSAILFHLRVRDLNPLACTHSHLSSAAIFASPATLTRSIPQYTHSLFTTLHRPFTWSLGLPDLFE